MAKCNKCKVKSGIEKTSSCTVDEEGQHHSFNGKPAVIFSIGTKYWVQHGDVHRIGRPAIKYYDGSRTWARNGQPHRLDGPAMITQNSKRWCIDGIEYSEKDFNEKIKTRI